jgi:hypothetical protein
MAASAFAWAAATRAPYALKEKADGRYAVGLFFRLPARLSGSAEFSVLRVD